MKATTFWLLAKCLSMMGKDKLIASLPYHSQKGYWQGIRHRSQPKLRLQMRRRAGR